MAGAYDPADGVEEGEEGERLCGVCLVCDFADDWSPRFDSQR